MDAALHGQRRGPNLSTGVPRPEVPPSAERAGPVLSLPAGRQPVRGILLDIEGTTTPIDFVYHVLFPYARARAKAFLDQHLDSSALLEDVAHLLAENLEDRQKGLDPPPLDHSTHQSRLDSLVAYIHWLMEQDRKATPLKSLQGKIDRKSTRLNSSHGYISYAVFCLKKKKKQTTSISRTYDT